MKVVGGKKHVQRREGVGVDAGRWVKLLRKLKMKKKTTVRTLKGRRPSIPKWLKSYVDEDDELLQVFKSRGNPKMTHLCGYCYEWFGSEENLRAHKDSRHSGEVKAHICGVCGARFVARILRLRHEKLHKYDLKYRLSVYERQPELKSHFRRRFRPAPFSDYYKGHVNSVLENLESLSFPCFACSKTFTALDSLQDHYEETHAAQICGVCSETLPNMRALNQHEEERHGTYAIRENYEGGAWALWDSNFNCDEANKREDIMSNIKYFHDYAANQEKKEYEEEFVEFEPVKNVMTIELTMLPDDLQRSSDDSGTIEVTILQDEGSAETGSGSEEERLSGELLYLFSCSSCTLIFESEEALREHSAQTHSSDTDTPETFMCGVCSKTFLTSDHRNNHEKTHSMTITFPYVCPVCQRKFAKKSNMTKHVATHETEDKKPFFECSLCGKQFLKENSLNLHQRAHAVDRKFRCGVCDRAYNYASLLKRHMRTHTGEMPYSCESCGMLFHELVSLHYHRKKVHTGERPHKCETCGRGFILSSDLKKHVPIHFRLPASNSNSDEIENKLITY